MDIWALGSVFFVLLFHTLPFADGGTLSVLGGHWRAALPKVGWVWGGYKAIAGRYTILFLATVCTDCATFRRFMPHVDL